MLGSSSVQTALVLALALAVGACSTLQVRSDYDPDADFSKLRTYNWAPRPESQPKDPRVDNDLLNARIRRAVDDHLQAAGYQKIESGEPDFQITFYLSVESKLDVSSYSTGYAGYRSYGAWGGYVETDVYQYDEGTLILDVIDPETNKLVWRGTGQDEVRTDDAPPEERAARTHKVVGKILERFPPEE